MESTPLDQIGARLLQARLNLAARLGRPVSQGEIAGKVGVHQKTVAAWEQGAKRPSLETIWALAVALEADPGALAFGLVVAPLKEVPEGTPGAVPVLPSTPAEPPPQRPFKEVSRHAKAPLHPIKPQDQGKGRKKA